MFAFDFDGVICDSARETGLAAWRAARAVWPERFDGEMSKELLARFLRLRPVIETGYENLPLMDLLRRGIDEGRILDDFASLRDDVMSREGLDEKELQTVLAKTRDRWIESNLDDWLGTHDFYPGVVEAINALRVERCVITTKQHRFTGLLLERAGISMAPDRVYGLEAIGNGSKGDVLQRLLDEAPDRRIRFFEDRMETLRRLTNVERVELYLVDWGYNTDEERREARAAAAIALIDRTQFERLLRTR